MESLKLRVAEALAKDVGRGIARLDPDDLAKLGLVPGDILTIADSRTTAAKAMPAYVADRGKSTIQIDGLVRDNAGTGLDQKVTVTPVKATRAQSVTLKPVEGRRFSSADRRFLARRLEGQVVMAGDRVRIELFGTRSQDFTMAELAPAGPALIHADTAIKVAGEATAERGRVSYEDIGGLSKEIGRVREMIELPLRYPEVFERLGIDAPKGVLLHGPPGCGKTLIARAVGHETSAHFIHVNGPEVVHKFYGESERHLRTIFEDARHHAPSIIFLDEIDAIAPRRAEVTGEVEKRVVAQLLALMDGLESRGQVIVIGATNLPNSLDPALRRPGRFDREIAIGIPDKTARRAILDIHTRGMPLASDVDLERLAAITHGYVGADVEALCREAAMSTLRELMPAIDFDTAQLPYEQLMELEVKMDAFLDAFREIEPSALREVFTEIPDVGWEDVGGLEDVKQQLKEAVEWPVKYPELFQAAHATAPKGLLLTGAPGTGKTLLAKALAKESGVNFISVKGPALLSKWVGESEKGVREVFKKARQAAPCIVFFDEVEALAPRRGSDSPVTERVVSQLLTELDGVEELKGVFVLAATNRPDILDPALLRPGRLDMTVVLPLPDQAARREILKVHTRGRPLEKGISLDDLAQRTEGLSGADLELICRRAALAAVRNVIAGERREVRITRAHLERSREEVMRERDTVLRSH